MLLYNCSKGTEKKKLNVYAVPDGRKEGFIMKKFCVKCGHEFESVGREVICPECKAHAAEDAKRAAVMRAKRASWNGESVPVRISGRASAVIRAYGAEKSLPFAAALDALLKASSFFRSAGKAWEDVEPYRSHRRDKHATEDAPQDAPQAAKTTSTASKAVKTTAGKAGKTAGKAGKKA